MDEMIEQGMMDGMAYSLADMILTNPMIAGSAVAVGLVVLAATAASMFLPTQVKAGYGGSLNKLMNMALRFTNVLAGNIMKNKNKDDKK